MATRLPQVQQYLVSLLTALPSGRLVFNGPPVTDAPLTEYWSVGDDGNLDSDVSSSAEQEWADLACTSRYERGTIPCALIVQSGAVDQSPLQTLTTTLMGEAETAFRADISLGGLVLSAQLTTLVGQSLQTEDGAATVSPFVITYMAQV